ncbi:erythronolide synthase, partial [candidate division KSB1 bacterium]|nr:erythronolide synthase [candidate division KSB1 bacterium]NIR69853.1 erythronolide synthase [candidate division KSB1 bacterium]NIS22973.1 erythronolide synthase [candidate division KSB1 bacterium]NIT69830.1 erythronolide synthase [candidate division KSB1 bacterium]NIU25752.1 erythronolide synthase [candidate division KSB1 bacterium]
MENTIAITPSHACDPSIAIAACRAGGLGLLDVGLTHPDDAIRNSLHRLATYAGKNGRWGIRWDTLGQKSRSVTKLQKSLENPIEVLLLAGVAKASLAEELKQARQLADQVFLEARSLPEALAAQNTGYDGIIIKGHEAGGGVGRDSSFIMAQHLHRRLKLPFSIQGGIGPNTAAAARLAGATGVVLCEQLWLTEESPFSKEDREIWAKLDGSETTCVGKDDEWFRFYSHSGRKKLRELDTNSVNGKWYATLRNFLTNPDDDPLLPLGQDIAFAQTFAQRFGTVGRAVTALNQSMSENVCTARQHQALAANAPLAQTHGTTYPIVQGPMTRVSDVAPFCKAVADGGGLPFLALALMRAPQVHELLKETQAQLGAMPWGVGILGFVPLQLRQEQLEVIKEFKPPFAIIAGGRPNQAAELEAIGISTYLHVPSPGLLEMYLKEGARKFIFEGRECGGHVGPRTSFTLWESAIQILLNARLDRTEQIQILFAGGISDSLSAAMVATIAAPLTAREMKIGVLMGTSYLFTEEAVRCGAITKQYQKQALACKDTTLLTSGIGHAVRCALTPYAKEFDTKKNELIRAGKSNEEVRLALERLNLGRLRIASKGVTRDSNKSIVKVDTKTQQRDGMYMIGDVASLYKKTFSIVDLHAEVSKEHQKYLSSVEIVTTKTEEEARKQKHEDIAIVGMACLFPGASNVKEYWHNILNRVDAIQEVSTERWNPDTFYDPDRRTPDKSYSKWGGFIRDIQFDPLKYGIPPASLKSTEPMQLLALETAWQALKDAGYHEREFPREKTSVIFGVGGTFDLGMDYVFRTMLMHHLPHVDTLTSEEREKIIRSLYEQLPEWTEDSFPGFLGNVFAGRIANRLNLMGSNFTIDAACASSLAAVEVASRQLQAQLCDLALVGTADGNNNPFAYLSFSKTHALSPHGRCRTFDDSADGIVISEGVAAMVLKRLPDAERDGDRIYAVIKGVGSSSDGRNKSLTAPHPAGQVAALQRAYEDARISPDTVQLVEAHGTGTAVGDKAEIQSLNAVFDGQASASQYCAVGSVKSMIGHTKIAAGMAGLMKCVLALKHRTLPATIGVEMPNSHVDFSRTPFYINTENRPWLSPHQDHPRRAAVSAFGFGGTNFHAV